jgi:hypothetical protein
LLLAVLVRLPHIASPLADNLQVKQVYVANKARSIARPPLDPLRTTLDFLDDRGQRLALTEEVPLYTGFLAAGYGLFGEHDWIGRILSLLGALVAISAYAGLTRREHGPEVGIAGAFLLATAPLLVFYGRAVLPDPWMLAAMLTAAWCYRKHLDGSGIGWLIAAAGSAALAPLCKYYGVMVLIPLAGMSLERAGDRKRRCLPFGTIAAATLVPVGLWMGFVFLRTANPIVSGWSGDGKAMPYLVFQAPEVLLSSAFYSGFMLRFLIRDCGPVTVVLAGLGMVAVVRKRQAGEDGRLSVPALLCWTAMGLAFYLLFAPKLIDHDYYELMLLPAVATWGAIGVTRLADRLRGEHGSRAVLVLASVVLAALLQWPICTWGMFRLDDGKLIVARRLRAWTDEGRRVVVMGPGIELATIIHYCGREGWALTRLERLPDDWRARIETFQAAGAQALAVYFEPKAKARARASLSLLTERFPVLEQGTGRWARSGGSCSYWILDLRRDRAFRSTPSAGAVAAGIPGGPAGRS